MGKAVAGGHPDGAVCLSKYRAPGQKISPHQLRHTDATHRLDAGAERMNLQALLGHESVATTPMDTRVGQARMEQVVARR
jgi:integrase/recombinase XerD